MPCAWKEQMFGRANCRFSKLVCTLGSLVLLNPKKCQLNKSHEQTFANLVCINVINYISNSHSYETINSSPNRCGWNHRSKNLQAVEHQRYSYTFFVELIEYIFIHTHTPHMQLLDPGLLIIMTWICIKTWCYFFDKHITAFTKWARSRFFHLFL